MATMRSEAGWRWLSGPYALMRRLRWVHLAPFLAMLTLSAWAFASPVGSSPDDDFHLASVWCALGGSEACTPGADEGTRVVSVAFADSRCYAQKPMESAACLIDRGLALDGPSIETRRGNFDHRYPQVYYSVMRVFAGDDLAKSALVMRLFNAALFVGLATALAVLLPLSRRKTLLWGWLVSLVPLGMFLIPSNNPSGWAVTGVGTAFLALLGWFESEGWRRWPLLGIYVVGVVMAAGARSDAAVYAAGATLVVLLLTVVRSRAWLLRATLPLVGLVTAGLIFATVAPGGISAESFNGSQSPQTAAEEMVVSPSDSGSDPTDVASEPTDGVALMAYNALMLPYLWTGAWGTWALGWLDTFLPVIVPWSAGAAFIAVAFAGLGLLDRRKAIALGGVLAVLGGLPVYLLSRSGGSIGAFQPRYLLPLIVLFALLVVTSPGGRDSTRFTRAQTLTIMGALSIANFVALQVNIRRYVTGADAQGFNLDAGAEWWWSELPVGPTTVWLIGAVSFAALMATLWPELRRWISSPVELTSEVQVKSSA